MSLEEGAGSGAVASKFHSGEERLETGGGLAYVALAAAAPGATSVKVIHDFFYFKFLLTNPNPHIHKNIHRVVEKSYKRIIAL